MVLARPLHINLAVTHGIEGAFHANRANINVGNDGQHHHECDNRVPEVGVLHLFVGRQIGREAGTQNTVHDAEGIGKHGHLKREQQRQPGKGH